MHKDQFQLPRGKWEMKLLNLPASKSLMLEQLTGSDVNVAGADANAIAEPVLSG